MLTTHSNTSQISIFSFNRTTEEMDIWIIHQPYSMGLELDDL